MESNYGRDVLFITEVGHLVIPAIDLGFPLSDNSQATEVVTQNFQKL